MEKSNEITHVNAELIPQDNSAESDDKSLSRRRVLEAGAAALALLMMPKLAFGFHLLSYHKIYTKLSKFLC